MKLRLLLTSVCNRNCPKCCNNHYDLAGLPVEHNFTNYSEVMLTGGEPMLDPVLVIKVARDIREQNSAAKIYLYTAKVNDVLSTLDVLSHIDGLTLTLHNQKDVKPFRRLNFLMLSPPGKSLRLYKFSGIDISGVDTSNWDVKDMKWTDDCPIPEGEVFKKY